MSILKLASIDQHLSFDWRIWNNLSFLELVNINKQLLFLYHGKTCPHISHSSDLDQVKHYGHLWHFKKELKSPHWAYFAFWYITVVDQWGFKTIMNSVDWIAAESQCNINKVQTWPPWSLHSDWQWNWVVSTCISFGIFKWYKFMWHLGSEDQSISSIYVCICVLQNLMLL